ncbi:MAG: rod shape-determining protein MreC [Frankiales bacterium]|nr:rod shape-determining protein MreC [Frankiales bacterium]
MRRLTRRQRIGAVLLTALALLFISLDFAGGSLGGARSGATGALGSLYRGTDTVLGPARRFITGIPDVGRNRTEIAQLQRQNEALRKQLADSAADAATERQLKSLQLQADSADLTLMPARVIATGPGAGFQWTVTVDVGSREKVLAGQTVTDGVGLVGRVLNVYPTTSVVLLASDPRFSVGARDARSGALSLATGAGAAGLTAGSLDDDTQVRVGDQLVTGPAGQTTFVSGLAIGVVTKVHTSADGNASTQIRPSANQTSLNLVGIILQQGRNSARPAITGTG